MSSNEQDKLLFTPGPLTTSRSVKEAMLHDVGSRDSVFIEKVRSVRTDLLRLAGVSQESGYESILLQGAGTYGLEAVVSCAIPKTGHLLLVINGAYGHRLKKIADIHQIRTTGLVYQENETPQAEDVKSVLDKDGSITHVSIVHCETTTGMFNDIEAVGRVVAGFQKEYIVDAMSSFGAVPIDFAACHIDYLVSSSNKCIEGVPGFSFIIARRSCLLKTKGQSRTLSLDIFDQWEGLEQNGQFRFTPPTHTISAFHQAVAELLEEGGVTGRARRYKENYALLVQGMRTLGFREYLEAPKQGYIISSFLYPADPKFDFDDFYNRLNGQGFVIYPGKLSHADCFRIGNIGKIYPQDIGNLLKAIESVIEKMNITL
ncbi:MAG: 2-aminoethylphosphonate--pyruvate transaminase [Desulfuromonadales bacterium]